MDILDFPKSTFFGRRIPKEKFYSRLDVDNALRNLFISDIDSIVWRNKLSKSTLNVSAGQKVVEIDLAEIMLKRQKCDGRLLRFMDQNLPHHIVLNISRRSVRMQ